MKINIIYNEDCLETMKRMDDNSIDLVITSPPYDTLRKWFEYMFVFCKGKPKTFNPIKDIPTRSGAGKLNSGNTARQKDGSTKASGSYITSSFRMRSNVWLYQVGMNKDTTDKNVFAHPARFPEKLAEDHILSWSNENDIVYDPFMGSGTTAKMALKNRRKYIGSEISKEYFEMAQQRLSLLEGTANANG